MNLLNGMVMSGKNAIYMIVTLEITSKTKEMGILQYTWEELKLEMLPHV